LDLTTAGGVLKYKYSDAYITQDCEDTGNTAITTQDATCEATPDYLTKSPQTAVYNKCVTDNKPTLQTTYAHCATSTKIKEALDNFVTVVIDTIC
jgi:hypothetical protein